MSITIQEKSLINIVRKTLTEYLKSTSFGVTSAWTHGTTGKIRAERISTCLNNEVLEKKPSLIWEILYAVYLTNSTRLTKMITEHIIYNGVFGLKLRPYVSKYDGKMELESAQQKGIIDMLVERIHNINSTRIASLKNYFDQSDNTNEQTLVSFFDVSEEK